MGSGSENQRPKRSVGVLLGLGIAIFPYLFAWLLLRPGHSVRARVVGFGWLGIVALMYAGSYKALVSGGAPVSAPETATSSVEESASPRGWQYYSSKDEMRGTTTKHASIESVNALDFAFPYNGGSRGHLILRRRPKDGLNVILRMDKGQFAANHDYVSVKFDDGPIVQFSTSEPSDGSMGIVFLSPESAFLRHIRTSNKVIMEAEFYQEGPRL